MSRGRRRKMPQLKKREFPLSLSFCSVQALYRVGEGAHEHWWPRTCLLRFLIEMPISSRNILTHTPRNNVLPATWASLGPLTLTLKIQRHSRGPNRVVTAMQAFRSCTLGQGHDPQAGPPGGVLRAGC